MAELGKPAVYRPGVSFVVCLRCRMSVSIENTGSSVRLLYDFEDWRQCDCRHVDGPVCCSCFTDLKQAINDLPLPH